MKRSRKFSIICAVLLTAITLSSCSKKPADALVGKWLVQGQSSAIEFRKDGTLTDDSGDLTAATYKFTDRTHMEMQFTKQLPEGAKMWSGPIPCEIVVKGDSATLTFNVSPDGSSKGEKLTTQLRRVK